MMRKPVVRVKVAFQCAMPISLEMLKLVCPSAELESAFNLFYQDFVHNDPSNADYYAQSSYDFPTYVQRLVNESSGVDLKPNRVPCSHFWLMDEMRTIHGSMRVRHSLGSALLQNEGGHIGYDIRPTSRRQGYGTRMLKLALVEAKKIGLAKVMVTADEDNIASRKVIEANAGQFESIVKCLEEEVSVARYWITL